MARPSLKVLNRRELFSKGENGAKNMSSAAPAPQAMTPEIRRTVAQQLVKGLIFVGVMAALLLAGAGRLDWLSAWVYIAYILFLTVWSLGRIARRNPELMQERLSAFQEKGNWDKPYVVIIGIVGPPVVCLVAGLDERFGWSYRPSIAARGAALAICLLGVFVVSWAVRSNHFFSSMVRIQTERGHTVVSGGPYRFVRHPGYVGMIISQLATPVMLGTLWALVPAGLIVVVVFARTAREDRFLQRELPGYADYAGRVRYRLVPGLW